MKYNEAGVYDLTYSATDACGNETENYFTNKAQGQKLLISDYFVKWGD